MKLLTPTHLQPPVDMDTLDEQQIAVLLEKMRRLVLCYKTALKTSWARSHASWR